MTGRRQTSSGHYHHPTARLSSGVRLRSLTPIRSHPCNRGTSRGFTLIELLVVITIIAVLAGLLMPAYSMVRARSNQTKCLHQLRTWGQVIALYAGDNEQAVGWKPWAPISNNPAVASIYQRYFQTPDALVKSRMCPAHPWQPDGKSNPPPTYLFARPTEGGSTITDPIKLLRVTQRSHLLLMIDSAPNSGDTLRAEDQFDTQIKPAISRHADGVNALFADMHVEWVDWKRIDGVKPESRKLRKTWVTLDSEP